MTDNGNQSRPVRTLTVKNFSVIKEATLKFGKITVLIGPQSSGKSLLCKLAYFFSQYLPEFANNVARHHPPFIDISRGIEERFADWFPGKALNGDRFEITYSFGQYSISASVEPPDKAPWLRFSQNFVDDYEKWKASDQSVDEARRIIEMLAGPFRPCGSIYIPSGRSFFSTPNKGFVSVSDKNLDWITRRFSTEMDFEYRSLIESSSGSSETLPQFLDMAGHILGGKVFSDGGTLFFHSNNDGRELPFQLLSSGTLELLPLLNPLAGLVSAISTNPTQAWSKSSLTPGIIYVEEPELSVFPKTQYDLTRLFAYLSSEPSLSFRFAVTTHSPYILTAFNDLIKAGLIAEEQPDKASEVEKVIPRQYWIKPSDFAAYAFDCKDGILRSIMDQESKLINGDILDDISSDIADQFGQLLEIQYGGR